MSEILKKGDYFTLFYRKNEEIDEGMKELLEGEFTRKWIYDIMLVSKDEKSAEKLEKEYKRSIEEILKENTSTDIVVELGYENNGEVLIGWVELYAVSNISNLKHFQKEV